MTKKNQVFLNHPSALEYNLARINEYLSVRIEPVG